MNMMKTVLPALVAVWLSSAAAQSAAETRTPTVSFEISAQPLGEALRKFGQQAGLQVVVYSEVSKGRMAPRVEGELTVEGALGRLLANSGLRYEYLNARTVAVLPEGREKAGQVSAGENVLQLAQVKAASAETGSTAAGQASEEKQVKPGSVESVELEEIVVTAQKRKELLQDVPISISVLSGTELDRSSLTSVTDALNQVPGVVASTAAQGGGTQMSIRGVGAGGPRGNGASPVAYYLDYSPFSRVRHANGPDTNPYDLERIEVLRGPQGTLYGAGGQGGVVRILTHDADLNDFEFKTRVRASDTEDGGFNYGGDLALNTPLIEGKLAARLVVGYEDSSGWVDQANENDVNDAHLRNYRLRINAQPTEQLSIGLSAWSVRNDWGANSASSEDRTSDGLVHEPVASDYDLYAFRMGYDFANVSVSSVSSYLVWDNTYLQDLGNRFDPNNRFGLFGHTALLASSDEIFSQEIVLNSMGSDLWRWTAGAFYRHAEEIGTFTTAPDDIFAIGDGDTSESAAVFGEVTRLFFDGALESTVGLRYFHDDVEISCFSVDGLATPFNRSCSTSSSDTFNATTPRVVLTWHPNDDVMIYGSYSEGFRSGAPRALAAPQNTFPAVEPDSLRNYEVGAKANLWNDRLSFDGAVYFLDWQDVQQIISLPLVTSGGTICCTGALANSPPASGFGIDFAGTVRPLDGLELGVSLSWNDLTLDETAPGGAGFLKGERLNYSSEYTAGVSSSYTFPFGSSGFTGTFGAAANYSSEQINRIVAGSTTIVIEGDDFLVARGSFVLDSGNGWTATLFGDNLTDESGGSPSTANPDLTSRIRPRTIGVQVDYRF